MDDCDSQKYLKERRIRELFQSLTVGLLHCQPDDHLIYLTECLEKAKQIGAENVFYDSFISSQVLTKTWKGGQTLQQGDSNGKEEAASSNNKCLDSTRFDDVITGKLDNLPPVPTSTIRVFLSSTFTDFKAERTILPKVAYPELQQYCSDRGLDFQVVDMRWGVTDEAISDHMTSFLCVREIATCQQVSCGPNFVTLLGNKYGYQPFPVKIPSSEFNILKKTAEERKLENLYLFTEWFVEDKNAVPNEYILQPIVSRIPAYNSSDDGQRAAAKAEWNKVFEQLRNLMRKAALYSLETGLLSPLEKHQYYMSVTEEEVQHGLLLADDVTKKALCYVRELSGITDNLDDGWAPRFIDTTPEKNLDEQSCKMLTDLVLEKVPVKLSHQNIRQYSTPWTGTPLENSQDKDHGSYLLQFCADFVTDMKQLIDKSVEDKIDFDQKEVSSLYYEVLQHAHFAHSKCETFCGRKHIIDAIRKYVTSKRTEEGHPPLVIHGKSGFGKTSIIAHAAKCTKDWLGEDALVMYRFLGTSSQSSTLKSLLLSLISQLSLILGEPIPRNDDVEKISDAIQIFYNRIEMFEGSHDVKPLVILLDSLDQLSPLHGAFRLLWLPKLLKKHIYLVVSVLDGDDRYSYLWSNLKKRIPSEVQYVEVTALAANIGEVIVQTFLTWNKRTLTDEQHTIVLQAFNKNHQALFLKLLLDDAKLWNSYKQSDEIVTSSTVQKAIGLLFQRAEEKYGHIFVGNALAYLTAGKDGLSGIEMEDVLSCDNDVLNEIYLYHDPPVEGIIRIPSLMWARLQYEIRDYIVERQADGKTVMAWYHRQFWETAGKRYLHDGMKTQMIHLTLAELYMNETSIKKTITLHKRKGKVIENADRQVSLQPLTTKNLRKLSCLPYHLLNAGQKEQIKSSCLLNFNWTHTKIKGTSASFVLSEMEQMQNSALLDNDDEVASMYDFLLLTYNILQSDPDELAVQALERLTDAAENSNLTKKMQTDAISWISENRTPLLTPSHPLGLQTANGPLRLTLLAGFRGEAIPAKSMVVCAWNEKEVSKINVWNTEERDLLTSIQTSGETPFAVTPDGNYLAYTNDGKFHLADAESGDQLQCIDFMSVFKRNCQKLDVRAVGITDDCCYAAVAIKAQVPRGASTKAWKQLACIFILDLSHQCVQFHHEFSQKQVQNHIDRMFFSSDGKKLVLLFYGHIVTLTVSEVEQTEDGLAGMQICGDIQDIKTGTFSRQLINGEDILLGSIGGQFSGFGQVCVYNINTGEVELSGNAHINDNKAIPFDVQAKPDLSVIAIGLAEDGKTRNSCLCFWNRQTQEKEHVQLQKREKKFPRKMVISYCWTIAAVGWEDGNITLVHIPSKKEVHKIKAHDRGITHMELYTNKVFMTLGWDHALKLWDMDRVRKDIDLSMKGELNKASLMDVPFLDEYEECVSIGTVSNYAITAPPAPNDGVKFWHLDDGTLDDKLTAKFDSTYKEVYAELKLDTGRKMADFFYLKNGKILIDIRRSRSKLMLWVIDLEKVEIVHKYHYKGNHFRLLVNRKEEMIEVQNGSVTVKDLYTAEGKETIIYPELSESVKKSFPKAYLTVDEKYLVLCNVVPPEKCAYIIDLARNEFICYISLPDDVSIHMIENGVYFLVISGNEVEILNPEQICDCNKRFTYTGLISSSTFVSQDKLYGGSFCSDNSAVVWNFQEPKPKLQCKLVGHVHQLRSISFSKDSRYVVTGSFDSTVRVWCTQTGRHLCMFFVAGAVDSALFSDSASHVIVHCYAAPKIKRTIILKLHNL